MVSESDEAFDRKVSTRTKIIVIGIGILFLTGMYFLTRMQQAAPPTDTPQVVSRTAIGFFGYPGEETGVPTTLVLIRVDDYHRVLMASSGAEGETVTQAARFSLADGAMSLSVRDIDGDEYMDVVCGGLVLYGSAGGLVVW